LANYLGGHPDEVSAFVRWERERVRTYVGRLDAEVRANEHPDGARAIRYGNKRFWFLVHTLADAVQASGTLTWRSVRTLLRDTEGAVLAERAKTRRVVVTN
jgi:hypothetical protein